MVLVRSWEVYGKSFVYNGLQGICNWFHVARKVTFCGRITIWVLYQSIPLLPQCQSIDLRYRVLRCQWSLDVIWMSSDWGVVSGIVGGRLLRVLCTLMGVDGNILCLRRHDESVSHPFVLLNLQSYQYFRFFPFLWF